MLPRRNLAYINARLNRPAEARRWLAEWQDLDPTNPELPALARQLSP
jgi:hypothetical protein